MQSNKVYNIGYRGGCGGFIFLHFLLLSENFYKNIFLDTNFEDVLTTQWRINNPTEWKRNEFWPYNFKSISDVSDLAKITYYCGPTHEVYFDNEEFHKPIFGYYKEIMAEEWPHVNSIDDFNNLPAYILEETYNTLECRNVIDHIRKLLPKTNIWLYTDFQSQNELSFYKKAYYYQNKPEKEKINTSNDFTEVWNNELVDKYAIPFLNKSDITIKLQDWINDPDLLVDLKIIDKINDRQYKLLQHWKSLHSSNLLTALKIKH